MGRRWRRIEDVGRIVMIFDYLGPRTSPGLRFILSKKLLAALQMRHLANKLRDQDNSIA